MENTKIMNSSSVIDRIIKIVQGFLIAGMIVAAIFIPLMLIFGEKLIAKSNEITLGILRLELAGNSADYLSGNVVLYIILMLVSAIIVMFAMWYCLRELRSILAPMKEGRPFEAGISDRLRRMARTVFGCGGVASFASVAADFFEVKAYRLGELFTEKVASYSFNLKPDLWFLGAALILLLLSYVFKSAEDLQKESDETL